MPERKHSFFWEVFPYTMYIVRLGGTCTIAHCTNCVTKLFEKLSLVVCSTNEHCTDCVTKRSILKSCHLWYAQLHTCTLHIVQLHIAHCTACVTKRSSQDWETEKLRKESVEKLYSCSSLVCFSSIIKCLCFSLSFFFFFNFHFCCLFVVSSLLFSICIVLHFALSPPPDFSLDCSLSYENTPQPLCLINPNWP